MKPHYRLHIFMFDGKRPTWWVRRRVGIKLSGERLMRSTNGFDSSGDAVRAAARL